MLKLVKFLSKKQTCYKDHCFLSYFYILFHSNSLMFRFLYILFVFFLSVFSLSSQQVILDEDFNDWSETNIVSYADSRGDASFTGIDFSDVKISNDEDHLFLYVDLSKEINIQSSNNITLYIDADNNANTGLSKNGIGAEIVYFFGARNGIYYGPTFNRQIFHNDINLITLPTVTSDKFEMSLTRRFTYGNAESVMGNSIKVIFSDETINGDRAPNQNGGYAYNFDNSIKNNYPTFTINKQEPNHVRFMSYNVLRDNLFEPFTQGAFRRIFEATKPDIIGFCEIYDYSSQQTADRVQTYLPTAGNEKWYNAEVNPDIRVVSRYPIIDKRSIDGNGAFLIDLGTKQIVFIVVHFPCCENDFDRQREVDNLMAFVRNVRFGISPFQVAQNTPIVICGDTNLVGLRAQQQTIITGDINNNIAFGVDFDPDWDDTPLEDAKPIVTNLPSTFTWNNPNGSFSAGRLDYVFYTGSVMQLKNAYSLWTPSLNSAELSSSGLLANDVEVASDHLPVICDFFIDGISNISDVVLSDGNIKFTQKGEELTVYMDQNFSNSKKIIISDVTGRIIQQHTVKQSEIYKVLNTNALIRNSIYILSLVDKSGFRSIRFYR